MADSDLITHIHTLSPEVRDFLLRHLSFHLAQAHKNELLFTLLTDFHFMEAKAESQGLQALMNDYKLSKDSRLQSIYQVLLQESHILADAPDDLVSHMYNILLLADEKALVRNQARQALADRPWLRLINRPPFSLRRSALWRVLAHGRKKEPEYIVWSPDGQRLAIRVHTDVGKLIIHLDLPYGPTKEKHFNPGMAWMWDMETGAPIGQLQDNALCLTWSPNSTLLAIGTKDGKVSLWDIWGQCQQIFLNKEKPVLALAWSPDGTHLAAASAEQPVRLWDIVHGTELVLFEGHTTGATDLRWSPDGNTLLIRHDDGTMRVWEPFIGATHTLSLNTDWQSVGKLAYATNGSLLAIVNKTDPPVKEHTVRIWDADRDECLASLTFDASVLHLAWSSRGSFLAINCGDQRVRCWDACTRQFLPDRLGKINSARLLWSPDESMLAAIEENEYGPATIFVWRADSDALPCLLRGHTDFIFSLAWSADSAFLASGSKDHSVRLWEARHFVPETSQQTALRSLRTFTWSADGRVLAAGGSELTLWLWDAQTGQGRKIMDAAEDERMKNRLSYLGEIQILVWSPDRTTLALVSETDFHDEEGNIERTIILLRLDTNELIALRGHSDTVFDLAWSPDGATLASASTDQTVRLWNIANRDCRSVLKAHVAMVVTLAWSPDGLYLASGDLSGIVHIWNANGRHVAQIEAHQSLHMAPAWSPDSQLIALAAYGSRLIHLHEPTGTLRGAFPYATQITEDTDPNQEEGNEIYTMTVEKAGVATKHFIGRHTGYITKRSGMQLTWSPDNQTLAAASQDGVIQIWYRNHRRPGPTLRGHTDRIRCLAWTPDGRFLASAGFDGTVRLWTTVRGTCVATAHCLASIVALCFTPDGQILQAVDDGSATDTPVIYRFALANIGVGQSITQPVVPLCRKCYTHPGTRFTFWYREFVRASSGKVYELAKKQEMVLCWTCVKKDHRRDVLICTLFALLCSGGAIWAWHTIFGNMALGILLILLLIFAVAVSLLSLVFICAFLGTLFEEEQSQGVGLAVSFTRKLERRNFTGSATRRYRNYLLRSSVKALDDEDANIRAMAVESLKCLETPEAEQALEEYRIRSRAVRHKVSKRRKRRRRNTKFSMRKGTS